MVETPGKISEDLHHQRQNSQNLEDVWKNSEKSCEKFRKGLNDPKVTDSWFVFWSRFAKIVPR